MKEICICSVKNKMDDINIVNGNFFLCMKKKGKESEKKEKKSEKYLSHVKGARGYLINHFYCHSRGGGNPELLDPRFHGDDKSLLTFNF